MLAVAGTKGNNSLMSKNAISLFGDDDDDDFGDQFFNAPLPDTNRIQNYDVLAKPIYYPIRDPIIESPPKLPRTNVSFFGDDDDSDGDDIFGSGNVKATGPLHDIKSKKSVITKILAKSSSLFEDQTDDDNLFGPPLSESKGNQSAKKSMTNAPVTAQASTSAPKQTKSLFDDGSSDDDDLFATKPKDLKSQSVNISTKPMTKSEPLGNLKDSPTENDPLLSTW